MYRVTSLLHMCLALLLVESPLVAQEKRAADLDRWLTQLGSKSVEQRARAAYRLGRLRDGRAVEPLIAALEDKDERVRCAAVRSLTRLGDPRAVGPLIAVLEDEDHETRQQAVFALGKFGDRRALKPLITAFRRGNLRLAVVQALGDLGDKGAVASLLAALEARNPSVRSYAAKSLKKLGWQPGSDVEKAGYLVALRRWDEVSRLGPHAVGPLVKALQQTDQGARRAAAKALDALAWKPGDKREQAYYLSALENWEELNKLGPDVVEPLVRTVALNQTALQKKVAEVVADIGPKAFDRLVALLRHEDVEIAGSAVAVLKAMGGARAVGSLVAALPDPRSQLRMWVADALGELGDRRAFVPLSRRMKDEDTRVRFVTAEALGKLGDARAIPALTTALADSKPFVRFAAARALSRLGDRPIAPLVGILKNDDEPRVREAAVWEIAKFGKARAAEPLIAALGDRHGLVRERAAQALDKLRWKPATDRERAFYLAARCRDVTKLGPVALEPLTIALRDHCDDDGRAYAIRELMLMGPAAKPAMPALEEAARDGSPRIRGVAAMALDVLRQGGLEAIRKRERADKIVRHLAELSDTDATKRRSAAYELGRLGDKRAVEPLLATMKDRHVGVRQAAAKALGQLKDARAVEPLLAALEDQPAVQRSAIEALGKLGDSRAFGPLAAAMTEKDWSLRSAAAKALGELGDVRALEPLIAALEDWRVQGAATAALGKLGDKRAIEPILAAARKPRFNGIWEVGKALARIGPASFQPLIDTLADKNPRMRWLAAKALGELGDKRAVDPLRAVLRDPSSAARSGAAAGLRSLGWKPKSELERAYFLVAAMRWEQACKLGQVAVEPLLLASKDERPGVRQAATKALEKIRR